MCFDFERHLAFCFSPVLEQRENRRSKTKRFDDRQSHERARHELKKKLWEHQCSVLCFGLFVFWGGGFCCGVLLGWLTGFPDL